MISALTMGIGRRLPTLIALALFAACGSSDDRESGPKPVVGDPEEFSRVEKSCAYDCPASTCAETETSYACQNLGGWTKIPHADTCEPWTGKYPKVRTGKCTVTDSSGEAAKYAGA